MPTVVPLAKPLHAISRWLEPLISDKGAMFVSLEGVDVEGKPLKLDWHLRRQEFMVRIFPVAPLSLSRSDSRAGTNCLAVPCRVLAC